MDWKHSARHRKLVCKEFQTERNHHVVLALDTGRLMNELVEGVPKLDRACTALLLLAYVSLKAGDRVASPRSTPAPGRSSPPWPAWHRWRLYRKPSRLWTTARTKPTSRSPSPSWPGV